ncbi:hypothetical protein M5K25_007555 [Dendrobium thyrsiflorum]|uniref:Uncharacterized protein n=1 Tax=Dendrobium thyrsiflorum TaxID=117978 RepID=A0ABD0VLM2_DENTH
MYICVSQPLARKQALAFLRAFLESLVPIAGISVPYSLGASLGVMFWCQEFYTCRSLLEAMESFVRPTAQEGPAGPVQPGSVLVYTQRAPQGGGRQERERGGGSPSGTMLGLIQALEEKFE